MILNSMKIENFKGIKSRQILFNQVTEISGQNGVGKSTVYDAFTWCLFGRDSSGAAQFGIEPRDKNGALILTIPKVECIIDGVTLCKELHNTGARNRCTIDGVTKSVGEYKAAVDAMISEDTFKVLTDVHFVCAQMHWTKRRELLLSLAGDIGSPVGFDDLLGALKGRTMIEFKALCQKEKVRLVKARDEIQPRIDEIQRGLDSYAGTDGDAELRRNELEVELKDLETARQKLLAEESDRQATIAQVQKLRTQQIEREAFLRSDNSRVASLIAEKNKLANEATEFESRKHGVEWQIKERQRKKTDIMYGMENNHQKLADIRAAYKEVKAGVVEKCLIDGTCPTCRQQLPQDQIKEIERRVEKDYIRDRESKDKELATLKARGDQYNKQIKIDSETIATLEAEIAKLQADLQKMVQDHESKAKNQAEFLVALDAKIAADVKVDPQGDTQWLELQDDIDALTIGESVQSQMEIIEHSKWELGQELNKLNNILAQADRSEQDKKRIGELEDIETNFNNQIMDLEKRLMQISDFTRAESDMITAAVNGRFKHVTWRLFTELKNGGTEDACVPVLHGVDYSDMSYGERILVGLDIVNVLAEKYGVTVPLFVDNAESYTPEIEWVGQVIKLIHKPKQKTLKVS